MLCSSLPPQTSGRLRDEKALEMELPSSGLITVGCNLSLMIDSLFCARVRRYKKGCGHDFRPSGHWHTILLCDQPSSYRCWLSLLLLAVSTSPDIPTLPSSNIAYVAVHGMPLAGPPTPENLARDEVRS